MAEVITFDSVHAGLCITHGNPIKGYRMQCRAWCSTASVPAPAALLPICIRPYCTTNSNDFRPSFLADSTPVIPLSQPNYHVRCKPTNSARCPCLRYPISGNGTNRCTNPVAAVGYGCPLHESQKVQSCMLVRVPASAGCIYHDDGSQPNTVRCTVQGCGAPSQHLTVMTTSGQRTFQVVNCAHQRGKAWHTVTRNGFIQLQAQGR